MRYKLLGKTGLRVSELCLGTMTFGEEWGWGASKEVSKSMFDRFASEGGNFIDTANMYTDGTSEKYVGEFMASERERFVLATKYTLNTRQDDPNAGGNHRKNMVQAVEASLKRLSTEYIDLLWVHAWDFMSPVEEVMRALDDMVRTGKVLYVGISDTPAWIVSQANTLADLRGWSQFVGLQIQYSLIMRDAERDLLPMARAFDIAVTIWGALGSGVLSGKYGKQSAGTKAAKDTRIAKREMDHLLNDRNLSIADELLKVAEEIGHSPAQTALAWARRKPGVVIPIIGARTLKQLEDNVGSVEVELESDQVERLNSVSSIELGFPQDFLARDAAKKYIYGSTFDLIDNHRQPV